MERLIRHSVGFRARISCGGATKRHLLIVLALLGTMVLSSLVAQTEASSPWTPLNGFVRRLDGGYIRSNLIDPDNPPPVELVFLCWNGEHLRVGCDLHNLGAQILRIEGREIVFEEAGAVDFYPYATLEVSSRNDGGWIAIGTSPVSFKGKERAVFAPPNRPTSSLAPYRGPCYINLDAFRSFVGKYEFGRVVLKDGGASQVIVLTDLLPPDDPRSPDKRFSAETVKVSTSAKEER